MGFFLFFSALAGILSGSPLVFIVAFLLMNTANILDLFSGD